MQNNEVLRGVVKEWRKQLKLWKEKSRVLLSDINRTDMEQKKMKFCLAKVGEFTILIEDMLKQIKTNNYHGQSRRSSRAV